MLTATKSRKSHTEIDEAFGPEPKKQSRLPNLTYPDIRPIRAGLFDIDISEDRQRDPELRKRKLIKQFGEHGEKFDFEKFEVVTAIPRANGRFFPSGGMGRVWAVMNLLQRPDLEVPTLIRRAQGDQAEKKAFVHSQTNTVPIKDAQLFMTYGSMQGRTYDAHRAIVDELRVLDYTTVPGHGSKSLTLSATIFAGRLGQLRKAIIVARSWWFGAQLQKNSEWKHKIEGSALAAIAAFLYVYDGVVDWKRLDKKFKNTNFETIKAEAIERFIADQTTHQGRDDAQAICKELVRRYNSGLQDGRLSVADLSAIRDDFAKDVFFVKMHDIWRMFNRGEGRPEVDDD